MGEASEESEHSIKRFLFGPDTHPMNPYLFTSWIWGFMGQYPLVCVVSDPARIHWRAGRRAQPRMIRNETLAICANAVSQGCQTRFFSLPFRHVTRAEVKNG